MGGPPGSLRAQAKRIYTMYTKINDIDNTLSAMLRRDIDVTQHITALARVKTRLDIINMYIELGEMEERLATTDDIDAVIKIRDRLNHMIETLTTHGNDALLLAVMKRAKHVQHVIDDRINAIVSSTAQELNEIIGEVMQMEKEIVARELP